MYNGELNNSCESCVVGWKNFKNLSPSELRLVNENRYEASFKPGEIILKQGSPASHAVFLSEGMAKIAIEGLDRKYYILEIALPSGLILGPGVHVHHRNSYTVTALTPVHACLISLEIINQLVHQNPRFAAGMIEDMSTRAYAVHNKIVSLTQKKMHGRLSEAILYFADVVFKADEFDLIISRQELGEMTNMVKESVVRILKELESSGVVKTDNTKFRILDKEKLRIISDRG